MLRKKTISYIKSIVLVLLVCALSGYAEQTQDQSTEGIDAVLVLDASGSMRITDPLRLRHEATRLFTQFLRSGDRLAVIEFADDVKLLRPLVEYGPQQDTEVAQVINSLGDSGEFTDIFHALKLAKEVLQKESRPQAEQVIILLSDGKMELAPQKGSSQQFSERLIDEMLPELRSQSVRVYSLAFSEQADKDLLAQISGITNAISWYAPTSDKIHEYFAELFLTVKKPQMQVLTGRGFKIDKDIQEATFYINREQGEEVTLISPAGPRINNASKVAGIKWFKGELFDVITIEQPESGQWQIVGLSKNEGFATLLTNLKLNTSWPTAVTSGETTVLEAHLLELNKPVVLPDMTGAIDYAFRITPTDKISTPVVRAALHDDGKDGDRIAGDGVFSAEVLLKDEGEYRLQVVASAPTFERRQQISFRVKPPLVRLVVVPAESTDSHAAPKHSHSDSTHTEHSSADVLKAELSPELLSAKNIEVEIIATSHDRKMFKLPATRLDNTFEVSSDKLPKDGEYSIKAKFVAEGRRGKKIQGQSQAIVYLKKAVETDKHAEEMVVVEDKKEEPPPKSGFPWLYLILLLFANTGLGFAAVQFMKKQQITGASTEIGAVFLDASAFEQKVIELEELSQNAEVDLSDPGLFAEPSAESEVESATTAVDPGNESMDNDNSVDNTDESENSKES